MFGRSVILLLAAAVCVLGIDIVTTDTFDKTISENMIVMLLFYAPWNPESQDFLPEYERIADSLGDLDVFCGKVDVSMEDKLYASQGIEEIPTIMVYVGKEPMEYPRGYNEDEISGYIRRLAETSLTNVDTLPGGFYAFARSHLSVHQPIAVVLVDSQVNDPVHQNEMDTIRVNFDFACKKFYTLPCAVSSNHSLFAGEIKSFPQMVMVRQFPDEPHLDLADKSIVEIDDILYWQQLSAFPRFSEFTEENEPTIYSLQRLGFSTHIITMVNTNIHGRKQGRDITDNNAVQVDDDAHLNIFRAGQEVSNTYRGRAVCSYVDHARATPYTEEFLDRLEINADLDFPMVLIAKAMETHVNFYAYKSNDMSTGESTAVITPDKMKNFVAKFYDDQLFPSSRRRHDIPTDITELEGEGLEMTNDNVPAVPGDIYFDGDEDIGPDLEDLDNDALLQHLMSF